MKNFFTPEHIAIELLILNILLKGFQDSLGVHKAEPWKDKWLNVIVETLLYATAGRRTNV
jgi:hypothetical protein